MIYKIKFPPNAVDGMLAMSLNMIVPVRQYHYDPKGSTVEFTPKQLEAFIKELEDNKGYAKADPEAYGDLIPEIEAALETVRKAVMESSGIAQAEKHSDLLKKCALFNKMASK